MSSKRALLTALALIGTLSLLPSARAEEHGKKEAEHEASESEHKAEGEQGEEADKDAYVVKVRDTGSEFQIPAKLWDLLLGEGGEKHGEGEAKGGGHGGGEGAEGGEGKKGEEAAPELATASFIYAPIQVELKEKNAGVLIQPKIIFHLPEGGSEIDLAKWTTGKTGSFSVRFILEGAAEKESEAKAFFYSRGRKRRVGDELIGSGCKQFMDLSSFILDPKNKDGLMVNTTRNFHDSVLGGHFLFSWTSEGNRRVTRVSFNDTANPQYFCGKEK